MFRLAYGLLLLFLAVKFITQASDSSPINPRGESNSHDCSTRTLFSIIWGCVSTTIICAWAALHPNIPPREGPVKGALRRVELMFWTIMAPEILPTLALNQLLGAMTVRDMYNKAKGEPFFSSSCDCVRQKRTGYKEDGMGKRWFWWYQIKSWFSFDEREESTSQRRYLMVFSVGIIKRRTSMDSSAWTVSDYGRNPSCGAAGSNTTRD